MWTVGVDGCRSGWVIIEYRSGQYQWHISPTLDPLNALAQADYLFVDMPIGLADTEPRRCEQAARQFLGRGFSSSVFPVPCRDTLDATDYPAANALNRALSGRGLSKQSWFLFPKIRELDALLRAPSALRAKVREAHPEVAFAALNGEPLKHKKKTSEGFQERLDLLQRLQPQAANIAEAILSQTRRAACAADDIADALCLALMPRAGRLCTLPESPDLDRTGLAMEICYFSNNASPDENAVG